MSDETLELGEYLDDAGKPEGFTSTEDTNFAVNNDDEALWAIRRLAVAQRRIDEVKRLAQIELDRINLWVSDKSRSSEHEIEYFERVLGEYLIRVRDNELDGRKKLDFPDGSISSRVSPPKVSVEDAEAFLAWADANGHEEWVRVKREADVATIKKVVDFSGDSVIDPVTGEVIAGLSHVEGGVTVSVKVSN
jgi:phage host-nuclease inhibitor protein Gam